MNLFRLLLLVLIHFCLSFIFIFTYLPLHCYSFFILYTYIHIGMEGQAFVYSENTPPFPTPPCPNVCVCVFVSSLCVLEQRCSVPQTIRAEHRNNGMKPIPMVYDRYRKQCAIIFNSDYERLSTQ